MKEFIKTENIPAFIKEHFPNAREIEMCRDYGEMLNKDIIVTNTGDLSETLTIELESHPSDRCTLFEMFEYELMPYDSVSLKGKLVSYSTSVVPSQR